MHVNEEQSCSSWEDLRNLAAMDLDFWPLGFALFLFVTFAFCTSKIHPSYLRFRTRHKVRLSLSIPHSAGFRGPAT